MGKRVRLTKGFSSRTILGMLLGWALAFEGFFALSISNSASIEGLGGIKASTFSLASTQLIVLGAFISIAWIIKATFPAIENRTWGILFILLAYFGAILIIIEGLAIVSLAGDVVITDFGLVSKIYIVLTGAQLFAIGLLNLRLWRLRNVQPTNWLVDSIGSIAASLLMVDGLSIIGMAAYTKIEGLGGILEQTVFIAGLQLFIIGMLVFLLWTIIQDPLLGKRIGMLLTEKRSFIFIAILSGIAVLEGVIASAWAGDATIDEIGGIRKMFVVAGCAQLFAIGVVTPLLWKLRSHKYDFNFLPELIGPMAMAVLATEGIVVIGLAAITRIEGIGGIRESTFFLAGAQLIILSLIGLFAYLIKDCSFIGTRSKRFVDSLPIITNGIVGLEGVVATVLAAQMWITDFSSVREKYVLIVGIQLTILAALALASWSRSEEMTLRFKVAATGAAAFLALMLPIAFLL